MTSQRKKVSKAAETHETDTNIDAQLELVSVDQASELDAEIVDESQPPRKAKRSPRERKLPPRPVPAQRDFFVADFVDVPGKSDRHSMEHPLYSLQKKPDMETRHYEHNGIEITITPSAKGIATIWDKDLLIYATSQLVQGINNKRADVRNRTVRFTAYDYFIATDSGTSGAEYDALEDTLERLRGTGIKTNMATGGTRTRRGFGMIEDWEIIERGHDGKMGAVEITLSKWLFNAIKSLEVLTINRDYFRLKGGLEKRLYELARKHCGNQATWSVSEEILFKKSGSTGNIRDFRRLAKNIIKKDSIPDYRMIYKEDERQFFFYTKDMKKLSVTALSAIEASVASKA